MSLARRIAPLTMLLAATALAACQDIAAYGLKEANPQPVVISEKPEASRVSGRDPLFDLPQLKSTPASLIGGVVESIDPVRDRLVLHPFGAHKLEVSFDPRTQFVRDGKLADVHSLHSGDSVHVETVLLGSKVFARTIHLPSIAGPGEASGQVTACDPATGQFTVRDELSSQPIEFVLQGNANAQNPALFVGALVRVSFMPGSGRAVAREVQILASPGSVFTFVGRITFLDLESRQLVVASATDNKKYRIQFGAERLENESRLHEGADVIISARFDGTGYVAENVTLPRLPIR